jgi:hypothetical protein
MPAAAAAGIRPPNMGARMIRKSAKRFSEKIMRKQKLKRDGD